MLLSSICQTISDLTVEQVEDPEHVFDFRGLRLDWTRLQTYISCRGASTAPVAGGKATGQLEAFR